MSHDMPDTLDEAQDIIHDVLDRVAADPNYMPAEGDERDRYLACCQTLLAVALYGKGVGIDIINKMLDQCPVITVTRDANHNLSFNFTRDDEDDV